MMTFHELEIKSRQFFDSFLLLYSGWNPGEKSQVEIRKQHSFRVAELSGIIAASLNLERDDVALARIIGLLHDLGRFPQLLKYGTSDDNISSDHAQLSIEEMERANLFHGIDAEIAGIIKVAILRHNKEDIPENLNERERLFCRIVRDADKLDILQSLTDYYEDPSQKADHTLSWDLPPGRGISENVAIAIMNGKTVHRDFVKTLEDVKVMQLSWVYDLNFKASFRILSTGQFVDKIYRSLPKRDEVFDIYRIVRIFVGNKFLN